jgi:hypothetical protein
MNKKTFSIFSLIWLCFNVSAQNLIPNYSFEDTIKCPNSTQFLGYVNNWGGGIGPIYFNKYCHDIITGNVPTNVYGHQSPRTGNAYAGIYTFLKIHTIDTAERDYIQVQLTSSLLHNIRYYVTFYVSLADTFKYACNNIGAYFSDSAISCNGYMVYYTPQVTNKTTNQLTDKNNWMKISGSFVAQGGEKYVTIGNFTDDEHSDTVFVNSAASPGYALAACYYVDDVIVSADSLEGINELQITNYDIKVFPNPSINGMFALVITNYELGIKNTLQIYNILGQPVYKAPLTTETTQLNLSTEPKGIYLYRVVTNAGILAAQGKLIIQ